MLQIKNETQNQDEGPLPSLVSLILRNLNAWKEPQNLKEHLIPPPPLQHAVVLQLAYLPQKW